MSIAEANEKRQKFAAVLAEPSRPTEYVIGMKHYRCTFTSHSLSFIGTIGDYIRSAEFRRKTEEIGRNLMRLSNETIKVRVL